MNYKPLSSYPEVRVDYSNLSGVDLSSDAREIAPNRASLCRNMYRSYADGLGSFLQTRPGFEALGNFGDEVFGVHFLELGEELYVLVHAGDGLFKWTSFPNPPQPGELNSIFTMNREPSVSFAFGTGLYILDGQNYIYFGGQYIYSVMGFVPTTKIASEPLGASENYQAVNLLSEKRKNSFRGDGESTVYYLDAQNIGGISSVYVNGSLITNYTADLKNGTVTFTTAPSAPQLGNDNVNITYYKTIASHRARIAGCKLVCVYDNRVFFSGNKDYPGYLYHSELNDPTYVADVNYYSDGNGQVNIKALAVKDGHLTVIKEKGPNAVCTHSPSLSYTLGRIYPVSERVISLGCVCNNGALAFRDDLVYLSPYGLEGINSLREQEEVRSLGHRSTNIDGGFLKEDLENARMLEWNGYLCILTGGRIYLADSRSLFYKDGAYEYEWFVWDNIYSQTEEGQACLLFTFKNKLYFGAKNGSICCFDTTTDEGRPIESVWESRCETAGAPQIKKSVTKGGCVLLLKKIVNSALEVYSCSDREPERFVCRVNMGGFDFGALSFETLSFSLAEDNLVPVPLNEKAFKTLKIKLRSDRPFGIGYMTYIAKLHNHIK